MDARQKVIIMAFGIGGILAWLGLRKRKTQRQPALPSVETIDLDALPPLRDQPGRPETQRKREWTTPILATMPPPLARWTTPPRGQKYDPTFRAAELLYTIPRGMLSRVSLQESNYDPTARSPAGAIGLMQIIPRWHPEAIPTDPYASITYAAGYLKQNYKRFGTWARALAAYNYGPTALARVIEQRGDNWLPYVPRETQNYVNKIMGDLALPIE